VSVTFRQQTITVSNATTGPDTVFNFPNDFTFYPNFIQKLIKDPIRFHKAFETDIIDISFITFE